MSHPRPKPTVLALDLEGTLISNAMSQIPRPGLREFLMVCEQLFPRIVMFTTVPEDRFREIARLLVGEQLAPSWFAELEYVHWHGAAKDLRFVKNAPLSEVLLADDFERFIEPNQRGQWIEVEYFAPPYPADDTGLVRLEQTLRARLR